MASACIFCSGRRESLFARAAEFFSGWWAGYTVLHNRGLLEEMLWRKRWNATHPAPLPAPDPSHP